MPTRRKFLIDCSALIAAALTVPTAGVADSAAPLWRKRSLSEISGSALASQVNTPFRIEAGAGRTIEVTLAEVKIRQDRPLKRGQRPPHDARNEKFSLIFSGSRADLVQQNTYPVAHEKLGRFDLFLVPINTRNPAKIDYQALVNRPRNHISWENRCKG
ncbi:MAG TPA: hypothetical protein VMR33_13030 [Candidatus Baltobacteraceae bacterium]|nr:hypothetical protein [Candidatus Baltobacteraceae bacterium]